MCPLICCCVRNHPKFITGVGVQGIQTCDTLAGFPEVSPLGPGLRGPSRGLSNFRRPLETYTKREAMRSHVHRVSVGLAALVPVSLLQALHRCAKKIITVDRQTALAAPRACSARDLAPWPALAHPASGPSPRLVVSEATARPHSPSPPRPHPQIGGHGPAAADISLRWSHTSLFPTDCFS